MDRRTFLLMALGGTAALALGSHFYRPSLELPSDDSGHRLLFAALLPVLLDGALPEVAGPRVAAENRTLDAIAVSISLLPAEQQAELEQLLEALENRFGLLLLTGSMTPLLLRSPTELGAMLEAWRGHFLALAQQAYQGLRELVLTSFYGCPEHWTGLNYVKPDLFGSGANPPAASAASPVQPDSSQTEGEPLPTPNPGGL